MTLWNAVMPVEVSHLDKQSDGRRQLLRSKSFGNRVKLACRLVAPFALFATSWIFFARVYHPAVSEATRFLAPGENDEVLTAEKRHEFL